MKLKKIIINKKQRKIKNFKAFKSINFFLRMFISKDKFKEAELERNLMADINKVMDLLYEKTNYSVN